MGTPVLDEPGKDAVHALDVAAFEIGPFLGHDAFGPKRMPQQDGAQPFAGRHLVQHRVDGHVRGNFSVGYRGLQKRYLQLLEVFPVHHMSKQVDLQAIGGVFDVLDCNLRIPAVVEMHGQRTKPQFHGLDQGVGAVRAAREAHHAVVGFAPALAADGIHNGRETALAFNPQRIEFFHLVVNLAKLAHALVVEADGRDGGIVKAARTDHLIVGHGIPREELACGAFGLGQARRGVKAGSGATPGPKPGGCAVRHSLNSESVQRQVQRRMRHNLRRLTARQSFERTPYILTPTTWHPTSPCSAGLCSVFCAPEPNQGQSARRKKGLRFPGALFGAKPRKAYQSDLTKGSS